MKKRFLTKLTALVLCAACLCTTPVNAAMGANEGSFKTDESIQVHTPDAVEAVFGDGSTSSISTWSRSIVTSANVEKIRYNYTFTVREDDSMRADVLMQTILTVSGVDYPTWLSGTVEAVELSSDDVLWTGVLEGAMIVDGKEYLVLSSFSKINDGIQCDMTIQSTDFEGSSEPIVISFGEKVVTKNIFDEIQNMKRKVEVSDSYMNQNTATTQGYNTRSASTYAVGNSFSPIFKEDAGNTAGIFIRKVIVDAGFAAGYPSGYGQTMIGYHDSGSNRLAVAIKTYCANVNSNYTQYKNVSTVVRSMEYTLKTNPGNGAYIADTETFDFNIRNFGIVTYLAPLFEDVLTVLQYSLPTSIISMLLENLQGTVTELDHSNEHVVKIDFGILDCANFDNCSTGMPIVYQVQRNDATNKGAYTFSMLTSVTYRTSYYDESLDQTYTILTHAQDIQKDVTVSLN